MRSNSFLLLTIAFLGCFYYSSYLLGKFNPVLFDIGMIMFTLAVVIFISYSQKSPLKGYWIRPSILFVIGFFAVNFQYLTDFRIGLKIAGSRMILHEEVLNHCLLLGVVGILAFVSGYIIKPIKVSDFSTSQEIQHSIQFPTTILSIFNVLLFAAFLLTIDLSSFLTGADYGNADRKNSQFEGLLYVSNALIVCSTCMKASDNLSFGKYIRSFPIVSIVVIVLYMLMRLVSGDRGPFIYTALLLFFGYAYSTRKKVKMRWVLAYLLGAMLLISLVGIARTLELNQSFGERMETAFDLFASNGRFGESGEKSILPVTEELGFSFVVNQTDVYAVEVKGEKLNYGTYTLLEIASSIPFMPSFFLNTMGIAPDKFSSSGFANYHYFGGYDRNYGIGTTIVGDFYLQFGVWGVMIGMFLSGLLLKFLDVYLYCKNKSFIGAFTLLFVILFSAKSIYMPRAMLTVDLPRFVLGSIILLALGIKRRTIA